MVEVIVGLTNVSTDSSFVKTNVLTMNKLQASHDHINNLQTPKHQHIQLQKKTM
jgi:hypothetical protein